MPGRTRWNFSVPGKAPCFHLALSSAGNSSGLGAAGFSAAARACASLSMAAPGEAQPCRAASKAASATADRVRFICFILFLSRFN
ncbi:hypothetical protein D9M68_613380 [compost metagenome]